MSDDVNYPQHYTSGDVEAIDAIWATGHGYGYCVGNALKYLHRAGKKSDDPVQDLEKACWYVNFLLSKLSDKHEDPRASRPAERSAVMERRRIYFKGQAPIAAKLRGLEVFDYKINVFDKYIELDVDDQEPWGTTCERLEALGFTMSDDDL